MKSTLSLHPFGNFADDGQIAATESGASSKRTPHMLCARNFIAFTRLLNTRAASSIETLLTATLTPP